MLPSKKDKGITLPPGQNIEIGFDVEWKKGKDEVVIMTGSERFILNGKNTLFLDVTSNSADSIRVQIIPDFRKRVINVVEVIDAKVKRVEGKDRAKLSFVGVRTSKDETVSIGEILQSWDRDIEALDKRMHRYKRYRSTFVIFAAIIGIGNIYLFTVNDSPIRYFNLILTIIIIYISFRLWNSYRKLSESCDEYKKERLRAFEVIKNK